MPVDPTQKPELVVEWEEINDPANSTPRVLESWEVTSDFFVATDSFSLSYYDTDHSRLFDLELQPVTLRLGDATVLVGRVDMSSFEGTSGTVMLQGRDYIADMIECNIDPTFKVKKDEQLGKIIRMAAGPVGISSVVDDGDASIRSARTGIRVGSGAPKSFQALRMADMKPQPGQGIYDFLNQLCMRHGTTIQPSLKRNAITLQAPNYDQEPISTILRAANPLPSNRNRIVEGSATRDYSTFPTHCLFTSKQSVTGGGTEDIKKEITAVEYTQPAPYLQLTLIGPTEEGRILPKPPAKQGSKLYRLLYFRDEKAKNQKQLDRSASRAMGERMRSTLVYNVTLSGHQDADSGAFWAPDTMIFVDDEICGVFEPLWVISRTFRYDKAGGAITTMRMIRPNSIVL